MWGKVRDSDPDFLDADAGLSWEGTRETRSPKSDES